MRLGRLLEVCEVHEKVALEHRLKSTKYELEGSYNDLAHQFYLLSKLPNCCGSAMQRSNLQKNGQETAARAPAVGFNSESLRLGRPPSAEHNFGIIVPSFEKVA